MPLYEFRCGDCNKMLEIQMKMSDPYPSLCPSCGKGSLTKIMSLPAFQLKGSGWYKDAYDGKSNQKPEAAKPEGASTSNEAAPSAPSSTDTAAAPAPASAPAAPAPSKPSSGN